MMKKTQRKEALRNISKQFVSYTSIVVIGMLAVAVFLGIHYSADALVANASAYMSKLHFRDFEITSTMLLTEDDIAAIKEVEGVRDVEGMYQTSATLLGDKNNLSVYVISQSERISLSQLCEGRMPADDTECAVEEEIMEQMGLHIGDTVQIGKVDGSCAPFLRHTEFCITGTFVHADHYTLESFSGGSRYIVVTDDVFDEKALDGCYTKAVVTYDKPDNISLIGEEYDLISSQGNSRLKKLAEIRAAERNEKVRGKYIQSLNLGQAKLDKAKLQLRDGRKQLDKNAKLIDDNEKELAEGKKELDKAWTQLESSRKELKAADAKLKASKRKLDNSERKLKTAIDQVVSGTDYAGRSDEYMRKIKNYLAKNSFDQSMGKIKKLIPEDVVNTYEYNRFVSSVKQYSDGLQQYNEGLAKYKEGQSKYNKGLKQYNDGMAEYRSGVKKLESAKKKLAKGEKTYAEKLKKYKNGQKDLKKLQDVLDGIKECRWVVLNAQSNPGYVHAKTSAENIRKLAMTFALLFVLVGVLVIYATVARMINEQRRLFGTMKALGLHNYEVAAKYLLFGLSATFFGMLLGTLLSYFVLQTLILQAHDQFYVTQGIPLSFNAFLALASFAVGLLIAFIAVWWACIGLLRHPAVELMKEKMPEHNVISLPQKTWRMSLYSRLILRNIRMDIGRVCVTVVSVAGCCTLLVIGFTLRLGISKAVDMQYREILKYDHRVSFAPNVSETTAEEIQELLDKNKLTYTRMYWNYVSFSTDREMAGGQLICGDKEDIAKNLKMTDPWTNKKVVPGDEGICIMRRTAEYYGVNVGDTITLYDDTMQPYEVTVEGIYQNFTGMGYVMSPAIPIFTRHQWRPLMPCEC